MDYFWTTFGLLLHYFWNTLTYFDQLGIPLDYFWTTFGLLLNYFWTTSGLLLDTFVKFEFHAVPGERRSYWHGLVRSFKNMLRTTFGLLFDYFWTTFYTLDYFWTTFGLLLDYFWTTFGLLLEYSRTTFGLLLVYFSWLLDYFRSTQELRVCENDYTTLKLRCT